MLDNRPSRFRFLVVDLLGLIPETMQQDLAISSPALAGCGSSTAVNQLTLSARDRYLLKRKAYYGANKERILAAQKEYRNRNPESHREKQRAYRATHKAAKSEADRIYRQRHALELKAKKAAYYQRNKQFIYAKHKEFRMTPEGRERSSKYSKIGYQRRKQYYKDYCKKWRAANPEALKASRRNSEAKRRAKGVVRSADPVIKEFYRRVRSGKVRCYYCQARLTRKATVDHIIAIDRGGKHDIANLCAACEHCNFTKWNKSLTEWQPKTPQGILPL